MIQYFAFSKCLESKEIFYYFLNELWHHIFVLCEVVLSVNSVVHHYKLNL